LGDGNPNCADINSFLSLSFGIIIEEIFSPGILNVLLGEIHTIEFCSNSGDIVANDVCLLLLKY